jgi:phospholipase/carboxylesterase
MNADPHREQPVLRKGSALEDASGAVIMVHGRGASASDILSLADEMYHPELTYLAPQAAGHTWYPNSFLAPLAENEPWLSSALKKIKDIVDSIISSGVPRQKIVVAGFSQGACLSTEFVARHAGQYGGLIAFTGGLIGPTGTRFQYPGSLAGMQAFLGAGDPDPHVPWERVEASASVLSEMGANVTLRRYPGLPHSISEDEIKSARPIIEGLMTPRKRTA